MQPGEPVEEACKIARDFLRTTPPYNSYDPNPIDVCNHVVTAIGQSNQLCSMLMLDKEPAGLVIAQVSTPWFSSDTKVVTETLFYILPKVALQTLWGGRTMLKHMKWWAKEVGASEVHLTLRADRYMGRNPLEREGFENFGTVLRHKL